MGGSDFDDIQFLMPEDIHRHKAVPPKRHILYTQVRIMLLISLPL